MIHIVSDTTSSLPVPLARSLNVAYLPQIIIFGTESYRDDSEIDTPTFLKKLRAASELPKTAAPPPALYTPIFAELAKPGDTVLVLAPSAEVSGTVRSAVVAAQDFPDADIRIIDTRTAAGGLGSMVMEAVRWMKEGCSADEIETRLKDLIRRQRVFFYVDTLEYLYKGGRIGGAKALVGSLLQVKPILTIVNGRIEVAENQRTKRKALARLKDIIIECAPHNEQAMISVMHCDAEDVARAFAEEFKQALGIREIPIYEVPPAIVVHVGPKVLAVSLFTA